MLIFPQLSTGALCQFPIRKRRRTRTIVNRAADGKEIKLADPAGGITEWQLEYSGLSDAEVETLRSFFEAAEGTLNGFTFVDPAGNLLAWSEQLDNQVWQKDPMLTLASGIADPAGGTRAWTLSNSGAADQVLAQTLAAPGAYEYCLSVYVRSAGPATATLRIGTQAVEYAAGPAWGRIALVGTGDATTESLRFGIEVSAGAAMNTYGLQVEAQGAASAYQATTLGGVYQDAHLASDELKVTCTRVNRNSVALTIIHANHI